MPEHDFNHPAHGSRMDFWLGKNSLNRREATALWSELELNRRGVFELASKLL